jgi:3-hydroxybutyryl-CoA dehydrogenase
MTGQPRIAVVGAGLMGHGIAQVFACAGYEVGVHDVDTDALASVPERVRANLVAIGREPAPADAIALHERLEDAVAEVGIVFECVVERLDVKQRLFERLGRLTRPGAVLASNTSVISIGEIGRHTVDPGRVVGTHWWNPPYLVPLVEVVEAEETRIETVEWTIDLLDAVGKSPVHVRRDVPGFVGNRLQHALWREAFALVGEGVCDAETLDRVVREGFGLRLAALGPMENADLVGLDLTLAIHEYVLPHLDRTPGPVPILRQKVECGELGMKSGRGFLSWTDDEAQAVRDRLLAHLRAAASDPARRSERTEPGTPAPRG